MAVSSPRYPSHSEPERVPPKKHLLTDSYGAWKRQAIIHSNCPKRFILTKIYAIRGTESTLRLPGKSLGFALDGSRDVALFEGLRVLSLPQKGRLFFPPSKPGLAFDPSVRPRSQTRGRRRMSHREGNRPKKENKQGKFYGLKKRENKIKFLGNPPILGMNES